VKLYTYFRAMEFFKDRAEWAIGKRIRKKYTIKYHHLRSGLIRRMEARDKQREILLSYAEIKLAEQETKE
jgi:hypothetical protein